MTVAADFGPGGSRAVASRRWPGCRGLRVGIRRRRRGRAPRPRRATGDGSSERCSVLMGDPLPVKASGSRTAVRCCPSTRVPLPSHAAAAACPCDIWPASPSARAAPRVSRSRGTTGIAPRPARCVAPRPVRRHAGLPAARLSCAVAACRPSVACPHPRATADVACRAMRCVDRHAAALQLGTVSSTWCCHHAGLFVPATSPVATE